MLPKDVIRDYLGMNSENLSTVNRHLKTKKTFFSPSTMYWILYSRTNRLGLLLFRWEYLVLVRIPFCHLTVFHARRAYYTHLLQVQKDGLTKRAAVTLTPPKSSSIVIQFNVRSMRCKTGFVSSIAKPYIVQQTCSRVYL